MTKYTGPIKEVEVVEKVKLTKEQAEAIDWLMDEEYSIGDILNSHIYGWSAQNTACLNKLKISQIAEVLYTENYEIEPEQQKFLIGNKVKKANGDVFPCGSKIREVTAIYENWFICDNDSRINPVKYREIELRHATSEEVFWYETLGREKVGEFKDGDIYIKQNNDCYLVGSDVFAERALDWYVENDDFKGLHPAESFRPFKKEPE